MAWTQADVDALKSAIARGVNRVRMNGEEVQYNSLADMKSALAMMEAEVSGQDRTAFVTIYPRTGRGL